MNFTLFGYPKTGKTTLFDILTGAHIAVHSYADGKREANERIGHLPDDRLDRLWKLTPEKKGRGDGGFHRPRRNFLRRS